jgi:hypothetical protein
VEFDEALRVLAQRVVDGVLTPEEARRELRAVAARESALVGLIQPTVEIQKAS